MDKNSEFVVYGKPRCKYCQQAKGILDAKGLKYTYKEIGTDISLGEFFHEIGEEVRTVPQIMVDKHLVGDYNSLVRYLKNGELNGD